MKVEVLFNGITAVLVQSFFAVRIYRLSEKNLYITTFVSSLIAANFVVMIVYTARAKSVTTYQELNDHVKALSITVNILTAASDIAIAASLVTMLHNRKTGFEQSNNVLNRLIKFTVNTGLLTSLCAIFSLIFVRAHGCFISLKPLTRLPPVLQFQVFPGTFIYICFFFTIGRRTSLYIPLCHNRF